jgi:hypothetical protein
MADDEEIADEDLPATPAWFITVSQSVETGEVVLNIGDLPFAAAFGLLQMAYEEMRECRPEVLMTSSEAVYYAAHGRWVEVDDDDEDDEEDE